MQYKWKTVVDGAKAFQHYVLCQACQDYYVCAVQCTCAVLLAVNTEANKIGKVYVSMDLVFFFFFCLSHTLSLSLYTFLIPCTYMCMWLCAYYTSHFMYIAEIVIIVCVCWLHPQNSKLNEQSTLLSFHSVESYKLNASVGNLFCIVH